MCIIYSTNSELSFSFRDKKINDFVYFYIKKNKKKLFVLIIFKISCYGRIK